MLAVDTATQPAGAPSPHRWVPPPCTALCRPIDCASVDVLTALSEGRRARAAPVASHRDRRPPGRRQLARPHVRVSPGSFSPAGPIYRERLPARFQASAQFEGLRSATVTIAESLFIVRPRGRRRVYELRLTDVARGVLYDVVKAELAARRAAKRGKGRRS